MSAGDAEERAVEAEGQIDEQAVTRLVERFQAGDMEAFGDLYKLYFDQVYGYLKVALKDRDEAEDIAQQAFTQALEALPRYELRGRPFGAWLLRIVRNLAVDAMRRNGRIEVTDPAELDRRRERAQRPSDDDDEPVISWISDGDLLLFVQQLTPPQRQAVVLRFVLEVPNQEIARILNRTPADVRKLQHRAITYLAERLTAVGRGPEASIKDREGMKAKVKQAQVLRRRRCALLWD